MAGRLGSRQVQGGLTAASRLMTALRAVLQPGWEMRYKGLVLIQALCFLFEASTRRRKLPVVGSSGAVACADLLFYGVFVLLVILCNGPLWWLGGGNRVMERFRGLPRVPQKTSGS